MSLLLSKRNLCISTLVIISFWLPRTYAKGTDVFVSIQAGQRILAGVGDLLVTNSEEQNIATKIFPVLVADLRFARVFTDLYEGTVFSTGNELDYVFWTKINTLVLVTGRVTVKNTDTLIFTGKIIDVNQKTVVYENIYQDNKENWRSLVHRFSDDIVYRITGERGITHTRIVFINDVTGNKELCMIDYDGNNFQRLTNHQSVVLLPRWVPDGKSVVYTSYHRGNPDLYKFHLNTGRIERVSKWQGLNLAGGFIPGNTAHLLVTLTKDGNSEIYFMRWGDSQNIQRMTQSRAVDIAGNFSPAGTHYVFISDRSGTPQVYVTDVTGLDTNRLTYSNYCDSPVWNPQSAIIAYTQRSDNGLFHLFTVYPNGRNKMQVTYTGSNENPAWSPDGKWLVFTSNRTGKYQLYRITLDGSIEERVIDLPGNCYTPHWSP